MYGKATTHLIRLSAIVQVVDQVIDVIISFPGESNQSHISESFIANVKEAKNNSLKIKTISAQSVMYAKNMLDYFNHQRLILSGYNIDCNVDSSNLYECVKTYIIEKRAKFERLINGKFF
jgi:hypothetical protein